MALPPIPPRVPGQSPEQELQQWAQWRLAVEKSGGLDALQQNPQAARYYNGPSPRPGDPRFDQSYGTDLFSPEAGQTYVNAKTHFDIQTGASRKNQTGWDVPETKLIVALAAGFAGGVVAPALLGAYGASAAASAAPTVAGAGATGAGAATGAAAAGAFSSPMLVPTLIGTGASVFGNIYGAKIAANAQERAAQAQIEAANHAADLQSKSAAEALAFQKQQAENDWRNSQLATRANYDQWAAREGRLSSLGSLIGVGPRDIPAYVPGVDPRFDQASSPTSSGFLADANNTEARGINGQPVATNSGSAQADYLMGLVQGGTDPATAAKQANQKFGLTTGNEAVWYPDTQTIGLPSAYLAKTDKGWNVVQRQQGGTSSPQSFASLFAPTAATATAAPVPVTPLIYGTNRPFAFSNFLQG